MRKVLRAVLAVFGRQKPPAKARLPPAAIPDAPQNGGRKRTIRAALPADRLSNGTLTVEDEDGRVVLGPEPTPLSPGAISDRAKALMRVPASRSSRRWELTRIRNNGVSSCRSCAVSQQPIRAE